MSFELNNEQRKYLGLELVENKWERVELKGDASRHDSILYFDNNTIRKQITSTDIAYRENQYHEETENRILLLPKTKRGKPKKLTSATLDTRTVIGVYFDFQPSGVIIGNHSTQNTYYSSHFENITFDGISDLKNWLDHFIERSTPKDLEEVEKFASKKRKRVKLKEGDFFTFKVDRRNYGFGRIICDLRPLRKNPEFIAKRNLGIMSLMTQPLVIKVYHFISPTKDIDLEKLKKTKAFPSQYIMDNILFYGDFEVMGNQPLQDYEYDFPISYSKGLKYGDFDTIYLQYGLIYKEATTKEFNKYLKNPTPEDTSWDRILNTNPYRIEGIGYHLDLDKNILEKCIESNSNQPYWEADFYQREFDLRNPKNYEIKEDIFNFFGLDASKSYYENLAPDFF